MRSGADSNAVGSLSTLALLTAALATAGCGGGGAAGSTGPTTTHHVQQPVKTTQGHPSSGKTTAEGGAAAGHAGADPYSEGAGDSEAALVESVRAYIGALDRRDGRAVCELFVRGALRGVRLRRADGGCAAAVSASIGYAAPGGPGWRRTEVRRIGPVELDPQRPGEARVRATVVDRFRGRREPSIEDDLVYLRQIQGRWLVVKPSSTFHRAIGDRDVPLAALAPP